MLQKPVVESLVVSLAVIVLDVLPREEAPAGRKDEPLARLLLDRGADPNARASIRKELAFSRDPSPHEYRDVTPIGWGRRLHDQGMVSQGALRLIAERGGHE